MLNQAGWAENSDSQRDNNEEDKKKVVLDKYTYIFAQQSDEIMFYSSEIQQLC